MEIRIEPASDPRWSTVRLYLPGREEQVSGLAIVDHQMRVGAITLRMGGIAGVWTHEDHRHQGYSRRVIERSIEHMKQEGYDVSMLFGIRNFYPKFGYIATPFDYRVTISPEVAAKTETTLHVRPFADQDLNAVREIYRDNNRLRTGPVVRTDAWLGFSKGSSFQMRPLPFVVVDRNEHIRGYYVCDDTEEHCTVSEMGQRDRLALSAMLRALGERAMKQDLEELHLLIPLDHPCMALCKSLGCRVTIGYPADGGGMMRIVRLHDTIQKLIPEFSRRWREARIDWRGELKLTTDLGSVALALDRDGVCQVSPDDSQLAVSIPQGYLIQMIMGCRTPHEIQSDPQISIPHQAIPVLSALFPGGYPYIWWSDRF